MARHGELELWGGIESTIARIGERFRDQVVETGHRDRPDDLDRIAALGIRTLRYPILWETVSPDEPGRRDFAWHDARMRRLRDLAIRPVAGLLHHGSGPRWTSLVDPAFPRLFARHAAAVARRYPWIDLYTPVNEPLTTARFSGLYGHWFPHERGYGPFLRIVVNQCRATLLAMRAIRRVNPAAKLVATDDLGRTFATPDLAYQAEHENERRWLAFDILFGRVDRRHPWRRILLDHGIAARELDVFRDGEAAPDIVGINHYLTSERFLDARLGRYPQHLWGSNGRDRYADVEAVRVDLGAGRLGPQARLEEAWERYGRPIVLTEVHHGSSRDEQLRWLAECWAAAQALRRGGADIRAVTMWSLLGTVDWNNLLTQETRIYEPGAFDVRGPQPRPTVLARAATALIRSGRFDHPVLDRPGWWRRDGRFHVPPAVARPEPRGNAARPILLVGDDGPLAGAFARIAAVRGLETLRVRPADAPGAIAQDRPWAMILADSGNDPGSETRAAEACSLARIPFVAFSPDDVFDGRLGRPCLESDAPSPHASGTLREARLAAAGLHALIVRTGPLFGPWDRENIAFATLRRLATGTEPEAGAAEIRSPTYLPDLVHVVLDLVIDGEEGVWHLANPGAMSERTLAAELARRVDLAPPHDPGRTGPMLDLSLGTARGALMPPLASALDRFAAACPPDWRAAADFSGIAAE